MLLCHLAGDGENSAKEFERFMKLVAALRRRAKGSGWFQYVIP